MTDEPPKGKPAEHEGDLVEPRFRTKGKVSNGEP